jgi:hypothetical protein
MIQHFFLILIFSHISVSAIAKDTKKDIQKETSNGIQKNTADDLKKIDAHIAKNELKVAMPMVEQGLTESPKDLEILMRKARIITLLGDQTKNEQSKIKSYEEAQAIANQMVKIDSKSAKGYLRRAIAKGKLILFKGVLESRSLVLELKSDTNKVLSLKSASPYELALAKYLLGRAHLKLSNTPRAIRMPLGLAWASKDEGGKFLKTAVQLSPNSIPFNLDYAIYLKDNGDVAQAKKLLANIASLEIYDPADPDHKETAKKLLAEM